MQVCEETVMTAFFIVRVIMTIWNLFGQVPCNVLGLFCWPFYGSSYWKKYQVPPLVEKCKGRKVRLKFYWVSWGEFINNILLKAYFELSDISRSSSLRKILNPMCDSINFQFSSFEIGTMTRWARSPGTAVVQDNSGGCTQRPCSSQYLFYPQYLSS